MPKRDSNISRGTDMRLTNNTPARIQILMKEEHPSDVSSRIDVCLTNNTPARISMLTQKKDHFVLASGKQAVLYTLALQKQGGHSLLASRKQAILYTLALQTTVPGLYSLPGNVTFG